MTYFGRTSDSTSMGSGVIISKDGYILDLTDLIAASEALKIVDPSYYQALEIGGKVYAMPYYYPRVKVLLNEPGLFIPLFQGENRGKFCGLLQSREAGKGAAASSGNQYENL